MAKSIIHMLVIDDDNRIRELLGKYLIDNGFHITLAADAEEAFLQMKEFVFDAVVVDIMLPDMSGREFTSELRKKSRIPILMLTALGDVEDRIKGLECGADDYLTKPFEPRELLLRINSILQRSETNRIKKSSLEFGDFTYDIPTRTLKKKGIEVPLTSKERDLFAVIAESAGEPVSREDIVKVCGGINERSVDVTVTRIRQKIEDDAKNPMFLRTIWGKGYILYLHSINEDDY